MYNYTYTAVTVKVVFTILYSPETLLQWAFTHLTLNHGFPIIRLSQPKKIAYLTRHIYEALNCDDQNFGGPKIW